MELQRDTQMYLSEITSKPAFDEVSLGKQNLDTVSKSSCPYEPSTLPHGFDIFIPFIHSIGQLLYANEDLVNAIKCYNDFMEKIHLKRALQHSVSTIAATSTTPTLTTTTTQVAISRDSSASPPASTQQPTRTSSDEDHSRDFIDIDGAGVGSGYSNAGTCAP